MTITEMHILCDELLDKSNAPWFNAIQKDLYLNLAQEEYVETRYKDFEVNEKRRKELISLVRRSEFTNTSVVNLTNIPDFYYVLSLIAEINDCGNLIKKAVIPVQHDDYAKTQEDPFHKNDNENPGYLEINDGTSNIIEVISEDVPNKLTMVWLKIPRKVNITSLIDSELPSITHKEIVDIAVRKMMFVTENPNYQVQINEINNQE
jgi:hypothetical protein